MISYSATKNIIPLTSFMRSNVRASSIESNDKTLKDTQLMGMLELYRSAPNGYTDEEMQGALKKVIGRYLPRSTIAARRNDINSYAKKHLIVCVDDERRLAISGRRVMVWKLNQYVEEV